MSKKNFSQEEKEQIIDLYTNQKISAEKIGKMFNCSAPTILNYLRDWHIPINKKALDLTNQTFGELTVIKPAPKRNDKYTRWICKCSCGKITEVRTDYLTSGHTTSCGHARGWQFSPTDIIGQKFGYLTVLSHIPPDSKLCLCDCGNIIKVKTSNLINGNTKSCGCYQKQRTSETSLKSLIGQRFGKLTVIKRVENNRYNQVCYLCKCDCGGELITSADHLRKGNTNSCGCIKSKGEMRVAQWLQKHNIHYQAQYSFDDIFLSSGRRPFFDFALLDENNNVIMIIEYQGIQHYQSTGGWNTQENHENTIQRDNEKRIALKNKNIPLIEIPYWEFDNVDSFLQKSVLGENEEEIKSDE